MTFEVAHCSKYARGKMTLSILMACVICLHFSSLLDHHVKYMYTIEHTRTKLIVSALDSQVPCGDANGEDVDH